MGARLEGAVYGQCTHSAKVSSAAYAAVQQLRNSVVPEHVYGILLLLFGRQLVPAKCLASIQALVYMTDSNASSASAPLYVKVRTAALMNMNAAFRELFITPFHFLSAFRPSRLP